MNEKSPNRNTRRKTGNGNGNASTASGRYGRLVGGGLALTLGFAVAGCSWLPDELDISRYIEGDDVEYSDDGVNEEFPNLADVPDEPRPASSGIELAQTEQGLIADRDQARYTDDVLRSRYAEGESFDDVAVARAEPVTDVIEPAEKMEVVEVVEAVQSTTLADDRRVDVASVGSSSVGASDLADERRIDGIEPASAAVIADRGNATLAEERRLTEARVAARAQSSGTGQDALADERRTTASGTTRQVTATTEQAPVATSGASQRQSEQQVGQRSVTPVANQPMSLDGFRAVFNDRFVESGGFAAPKQVAQRATDAPSTLNVDNGDLPPSLQQQHPSGPSVSFLAATINFATGSSNLAGKDNTHLKEVGALFNDFGGMLKVVGHASSRTRDLDPQARQLANFNVSLERANAVANALMRQGVPADKVQVVAMADNEPLSHEYMPAGERENQRAEVYIEY